MAVGKKQIDEIMKMVQQAGGKTQLPTLPVPELNKTLEDVTGQVLSSAQRLNSVGVDTTQLTDTRNPLEQMLNLTPDQHWFLDIMEVINRPQQALFGAITGAQTGKDVGAEALKGFTGQQDYYGGEIVRNMAGLKEDGSIDWTDFAGFALDVVLDPADLALAFVTGGASTVATVADTTADALKVADTAIDASKVVGTLGDDVAEGLTKGAKAVANKINIPEALQDTFLGKGNRLYKPADAGEYLKLVADKNFRKFKGVQEASLTSLVMKPLGAGFKVGTALTDSIVESTLAKVDIDGKSLGAYKALKDAFKKSANDMGAYVKRAVSASGERYNTVMEQLAPSYNKFTSYIQETAKKTGLPEDVIAVRGMRAYEYHYLKDRNLVPTKFLDFITGTKYKYLPDSEDTLTSIRIIFGEEAVSKIERVTIDDIPVLKFDDAYWSKTNKANISRLGTGIAKVDLMKKADITASEKALKAKDPEAFANYEAQKKAYNAELNERVKKQYAQQYPEDFKPKTVAQRQKLLGSIKTKLMKEDIQAGRGIQKVLQEAMPSDEVGSYFYANSKIREYDIKALNLENESIARSIKKDLDLQVDKAVEGKYPASGEPKGLVEKKQYYKDRAKFASEMRKELYETELDPFIRKKLPESYKPASYQRAKANLKEAIGNVPEKYKDYKVIEPKADTGIHYGDMKASQKSETIGQSTGSRGTGHYGTGLYVLSETADAGGHAGKTANKIDMSDYNLFRVRDADSGYKLHNGLHEINGLTDTIGELSVEELDDLGYMLNDSDEKIDLINDTINSFAPDSRRAIRTTLAQENAIDEFVNQLVDGSEEAQDVLIELPRPLKDLLYEAKLKINQPAESIAKPIDDDFIDSVLNMLNDDATDVADIAVSVSSRKYSDVVNDIMEVSEKYGRTVERLTSARKYLMDTLGLEYSEYREAIGAVFNHLEIYARTGNQNMDSLSTVFMKKLGYEGVDVRGIKALDNTTYGSVIYDVKKTQQVAQQVPVDNLEETIKLADAGNTYPEGELVKIGTFYTPEQIQALEADLAQDWVKDFVTKYDEVITNTQKIIGQSEFGDASALINQSIKGYTTHTPARETKEVFEKIKKEFRAKEMDYSFFAPGSTASLKSREYLGSALEANNFRRAYYKEMLKSDEWLKTQLSEIDDEAVEAMEEYFDMDLFSEDARTSLGTMMTKVYGSMNYNHRTTEMAIAMSFGKAGSETSAFKVMGRNDGIPAGYTKIANDEVAKLRNTLTQTRKYTGKGMFIDSLIKTLDEGLSDKNMAVMETHLYNMLVATKGKSAESAWELVDMFNKTFKVGKTLSPSFNMKNLFGLASNQWLSGVPIQDIFKNWNKSVDGYKKMVAVNDKVIKSGFEALTEEESKLYTVYREFLDAGFMSKQTIYRLNDLEDTGVYKLTEDKLSKSKVDTLINNPVTRANMEMNVWADNRARLGLYMYAKENPDYLRKLGFDPERADSAMKAVRMVLFDPNDLTFFEDDVMKRLIPFYTFTRQNLAFQMKNLAKNSERYYKLYKTYNAWNKEIMGLDKEDMAKYQRDQFYVPIFSKKDGSYVALKTSLPVSALTEITLNPQELLQNVVSKTTPLIKAPFEMATGTNTFTGQPIQNYQGEPSKNIMGVSKGTEWLLSQVGADVPLRGASGILNTVGSLAKGKPQDALGSLFEQTTNATGNIDPYQNQVSKQYQQLNVLNDKIKALKASGKTVPTISELTSKQKNDELATRASDLKKITDMINNIKR